MPGRDFNSRGAVMHRGSIPPLWRRLLAQSSGALAQRQPGSAEPQTVLPVGLEPTTSGSHDHCSNHWGSIPLLWQRLLAQSVGAVAQRQPGSAEVEAVLPVGLEPTTYGS